jgi:protein-disulfide isomerase
MSKKKSQATRQAEAAAAAERAAAIRQQHERSERRRRTAVVSGVVVGVFALVFAIGYAVQSSRDTTGEQATPPSGAVDRYAVPRGEASAPVTVTVYEDFMCPHCAAFEAEAGQMLAGYADSGDAQLRYHVMAFVDDYSVDAANAYAAVLDTAGPEAAGEFHDRMFRTLASGATPSDEELVALAVESGATESEVAAPIEELAFEQWVVNATDAAGKDGVHQTPTVMVDGEPVEYATTRELASAVEDAIRAANDG